MFVFKSSLLLIVLTVHLNGCSTTVEAHRELESAANVNLAALHDTEGNEYDNEIQEPLHDQDTKCEGNSWCWNGGTCDSGKCKCLPGTKGPFCEIVEGCENTEEQTRRCGNPDDVYCVYNVTSQKPYCRCANVNFLYDPHYKICKECDCGYYSNCSFVNGKKKCACRVKEGYGVRIKDNKEEHCDYCFCGIYSEGCTFYGYEKTVCNCKPGFSQRYINKCSECNCGPHGNCTFDYWRKNCACEKGYSEKDGICQQCDCGDDGACLWNDDTGEKRCDCKEGYGIKNGICAECNCYMDNNKINCTFLNDKRMCSCPDGYEEDSNSTCVDINECMNETACPPNSICKNAPGSYECRCETGFRLVRKSENATVSPVDDEVLDPKVDECEDINECVEYRVCIYNETTNCINTPGSYKCLCKEGFSIYPSRDSAEEGCLKNEPEKSYTTVYVVLCVVFGVIILGVIGFFARRRLRK